MEFEINTQFADLADDALAEYAQQVRDAARALLGEDTLTDEQLTQAEAYSAHLDEIESLQTTRGETAAAAAARRDALAQRFSETEPEPEPDPEPEPAPEPEPEPEAEPVEAAITITAPDTKTTAKSTVATLAAKTQRPRAPVAALQGRRPITITAAADVPEFATGSDIPTMDGVGQALVNRMKAFPTPNGDGKTEDLRKYGVAHFSLDFEDDLVVDLRDSEERQMEVFHRAAKEARLEGGSLVAAGGWCAPSETLYDLCSYGTAEGILSIPEVGVKRGGIKFPGTPDFSTVYAAITGFDLTEAQVIAGSTKTCYEVPCPTWTDVRLDAVGICIKAPILTNAAFPELVRWYLDNAMLVHQHRINAKVITKMATLAGAARTPDEGYGAVSTDTFEALTLYASHQREKYRMALNATFEVVLPHYAQDILRADMSRRTGMEVKAITDQMIAAEFAARKMKVSYVYDWQGQTQATNHFPATFNALMYPAGTFVKGTSDVIRLDAVYDAASLVTNIYTALFFEEGVLVTSMCNEATLITIDSTCRAGETGEANLACA